ncbi:MAG: hypothetical protein V1720_05155 [bacterium]
MNEKKFITKWINEINAGLARKFPDDYVRAFDCEMLELPGKHLIQGSELFGKYEILDIDGNPIMQTESYLKSKYIIYSSQFNPFFIPMPKDENDIKAALKEYEKELDGLLHQIEKEYKTTFPEAKNFHEASNQIFKNTSLKRFK